MEITRVSLIPALKSIVPVGTAVPPYSVALEIGMS
jgi:hypothetical protein